MIEKEEKVESFKNNAKESRRGKKNIGEKMESRKKQAIEQTEEEEKG